MAHGEFCCWDQEILRGNLKACFNKGDGAFAQEDGMVVSQIFIQMETANVMNQIYLFQHLKSATDMWIKGYLDKKSGLNQYNNGILI